MFPDPDHQPAGVGQQSVLPAVTRGIGVEFRSPERDVGGGHFAVLRAAVPKAAVDEDNDPGPREGDVGPDESARGPDGKVLAVAQPGGVQGVTQSNLGFGIAAFDRGHVARPRGRGRNVGGHIGPGQYRSALHGGRGPLFRLPPHRASSESRPLRGRGHRGRTAACARVASRGL